MTPRGSLYWDGIVGGWKGATKRSAWEETSLRVRILDERHIQDVYDRLVDELGQQAVDNLGPLDMSRNALVAWVRRLGRAYRTRPPLVTGLDPALAALIGDMTAATTIKKYALAGGVPMPSRMLQVAEEALRYRIGANYVGISIGWSASTQRPFLRTITPDDLAVEYHSDDPLAATIVRHRLQRQVAGEWVDTVDEYDLTDLDRPTYRTMSASGEDITKQVHGKTYNNNNYWWRYQDGRPFCRIVISGDPREPFRGSQLCELVLKSCMFYTHFGGAIRDSGHPQRNVRGLHLVGEDSQQDPGGGGQGQTGIAAGATTVLRWVRDEAEDPGEHWQDNPGADPEKLFRAVQLYEMAPAATALGLPLDYSSTGGEPTEQERVATEEEIRSTYPACRGQDVLLLRRIAAICNRATGSTYAEGGYGVLYREEVEEALTDATPREPKPPEDDEPEEGEEE